MAEAGPYTVICTGNGSVFGAIISQVNNDNAYFGHIKDNQRSGYGIQFKDGGSKAVGHFSHNCFHGYGVSSDARTRMQYHGRFENERPIGKIKKCWSSGEEWSVIDVDRAQVHDLCDFSDVQPLVDKGSTFL